MIVAPRLGTLPQALLPKPVSRLLQGSPGSAGGGRRNRTAGRRIRVDHAVFVGAEGAHAGLVQLRRLAINGVAGVAGCRRVGEEVAALRRAAGSRQRQGIVDQAGASSRCTGTGGGTRG